MANNQLPAGWLPRQDVRSRVAHEPVIFMTPERVYNSPDSVLDDAEDYYHKTLEYLCGKQIWEILNVLGSIETEKLKRLREKAFIEKRNKNIDKHMRRLQEAEDLVPVN